MADIEFATPLVAMGPNGAWVFLYFPEKADKLLGTKARVPVVGKLNGSPSGAPLSPPGTARIKSR